MNHNRKLKVLNSIVSALESPDQHLKRLKRRSLILTVVAWLGLFISFLLYFQKLKGIYLPVLASFSGILYGLSMYLDSTIKQWPIVAKHVNLESVKNEINEIKT